MVFGAIVWFIGWLEVSDRAALDDQIAPLNLAVVGVLIIGAGQAAWFLAGRRAVALRRRVLLGAEAKPSPVRVAVAEDLFAGREHFYHRLDCAMLTERQWTATSRSVQEEAGRSPCGLCKP
jgi:hypothetical protein